MERTLYGDPIWGPYMETLYDIKNNLMKSDPFPVNQAPDHGVV